MRLPQQIGIAGQGLIQPLQGFLKIFALIKDIQRPADGQGFILRRRRLGLWRGTLLLHAQEHPLGLIRAGQRIQNALRGGGGFWLLRLRPAHRAEKSVLPPDIKQRRNSPLGQGGIILRRALQHLIEGMLGQGAHGIGIKNILIDFTALGTIILVCADFVGVGGDAQQIHHAPAAQGTHAILEGMLLVAIRHHAQTAAVGPQPCGFLLHVAMHGQQRTNTEIGALNIVLLNQRENELLFKIHRYASTHKDDRKRLAVPPARPLLLFGLRRARHCSLINGYTR